MTTYRWTLSLHDGAEIGEGTVSAASLADATDIAILAAFGDDGEVEPDRKESGFVSWATLAGATTLTVEIAP